jgi:3-deoxy-manno-octulosonate cytidylyltransferase (CMP-KDO synthetase)
MMRLSPDVLLTKARQIRLVVLDVDGVLSAPTLTFTEDGETHKPFDVRDGLGIRLLLESGIDVAVITARSSRPLERRISDLKIPHYYAQKCDKRATLDALLVKLGLTLEQVCFVGDDLFDVPCLKVVGLAACVSDARECADEFAHYVAAHPGGAGAVRDVAELILDAQFGLRNVQERFLQLEASRASASDDETCHPNFTIVIPARYASSRLPGKPLVELDGKPMIVRVCENAARASATALCVATDDERIRAVVQAAGFTALMTSPHHASGTDRLAEVVERLALSSEHIVVNVQGDEPLLDPTLIDRVALDLHQTADAGIATLATPIHEARDLFDPNVVKVVLSARNLGIYFSRAPVPWARGVFSPTEIATALPREIPYLRHVGLYAYRAKTIQQIAKTAPPTFERAESLEQLRALWLGIGIKVAVVEEPPGHGVDTEEDVRRVEAILAQRAAQSQVPRKHVNGSEKV